MEVGPWRPKALTQMRNRFSIRAVRSFLKLRVVEKADDLTVIKGIGRAVQGLLNGIGVFHYDQIASWNDEESRWIERNIGFPRRVEREDWVAQAAKLANAANKASAKQADKPRKAPAKPRPRRTKKQANSLLFLCLVFSLGAFPAKV